MQQKNPVIVVGGGMAGLTAAAFLVQAGKPVILFEKQEKTGGLVNSFDREGYVFDGGLRAVESSGMILSTLKELGIEVPLFKSHVSLGIAKHIITLKDTADIAAYETMLKDLYPAEAENIRAIVQEIRKVMDYMMVLFASDAPAFSETRKDGEYLRKILLPWLWKLIKTVPKINRLQLPVEEHLKKFTDNQSLIDIIIQHFFKGTPTSFALSYFLFYFDYHYPLGGTGMLSQALERFIREKGGEIRLQTEIDTLDPEQRQVRDTLGESYTYSQMIWAADLKRLYSMIDITAIKNKRLQKRISEKQAALSGLRGAESIFSMYLGINKEKEYFSSRCSEHFFYTPDSSGISKAEPGRIGKILEEAKDANAKSGKAVIKDYLRDYFRYNTFEISFPVLRDARLAPKGKTGMIVSTLFDYDLTNFIANAGWYEEFKIFAEDCMIEILENSIFPGLSKDIELRFSATPLSIQRHTGNTDGAIVGWSFTNPYLPVPTSMMKMPSAVNTILPKVFRAGQWTYSPAGLPISIMTGRMAAKKLLKSK
ncbi:MAG: NAD(P)/FAD-dependent oxidoreductase [bacterium]|jgi:phytoene dehydrogenase-like protein|nr:NAD(P)/FAD-dependent oxidoreductase [bacterium]